MSKFSISAIVCTFGLSILLCGSNTLADFTPPADGKLTEKQVTTGISILKEQMDALRAAGKATEGSQSGAANTAIMMRASEKVDAAAAKYGMPKDEFDWVSGQLSKTWTAALMTRQWDESGKPDLEKQIKTKEAERETNKTRLATYEQAMKDGKRVLTKDQRDNALLTNTGDRDSAVQELQDRQQDLKNAKDELTTHQKEAADADALVKNPPADISADDRPGYVEGKKTEAQTARDAIKDSTAKVADAQKAADEVKGRLQVLEGKLKNPDVPVTDEEKAQVKQEDQQAIDDTKKLIDDEDQTIKVLNETLAAGPPKFDQGNDRVVPENLALMKAHLPEYLEAIGASDLLKK